MKTILFPLKSQTLNNNPFEVLRPFTQGPAVRQLQQDLNRRFRALGVSDLPTEGRCHRISITVDGWFGHETLAAVKYLQCASGLPVNGHVTEAVYAFIIHGFSGLETLALGSTGTSVAAIKQMLCKGSDCQLSLDDVFDDVTQQAVQDYQRSMGLRPDGVIGKKAWAVIVRSRLGSLPCIALIPNIYVTISPV